VYLAVILDLFSRRVVALDDHMRTELVLKALEMARENRDIMSSAIFLLATEEASMQAMRTGVHRSVQAWFKT
jgi:transposase InsO family protein